jgi:hypothetical protein
MGRVARLILLVVVSVCVVFCVLYCLQNNPVFSSVTISHILKNEKYELCFSACFFVDQITTRKIMTGKKGTVVWPSVEIKISYNHLSCQNTNTNYHRKYYGQKKRYSRLAVGWNKSQITVCRVKIQTPTTTGKNYGRKKRYSHLAYTICNTRNILTAVWLSVGINLR